MNALLIFAWVAPLAAAALAWSARLWWLPAVAALPALAAAALVPAGQRVDIPWLLLGAVLGLDEIGRIFLAFTAVLWLAAGLYGAGSMRDGPHAARFRVFFLLAMAGNLWLIVGLDVASFYVGFGLMGLASYGLVVHEGDRAALRAGKVYLTMTVIGELALFSALVLIAGHAGGTVPDGAALVGLGDLAIGLLFIGLSVKAGLVPVHVWLPLAHPAAPVPASAVLSGAMIKVALLGWLRFLPVGLEALTDWGLLLVFVGLMTLFFAVPIGLTQSNPKVILAYSSVGKMGFLALALGVILIEPWLAPAGVLAISLYAAHHALVKGGLFLGVGLRHHAGARWPGAQWLVLAGTAVLALSLAGVPPSSGAVAKHGVEPLLGGLDWGWLGAALTLSTVATALLMGRFMWVIWRTEPHPVSGYAPGGAAWGVLVLLTLLFPLVLGTPAAWLATAAPIGAAVAIGLPVALVAWRRPGLLSPTVDRVPPGDLIKLIRPVLATFGFAARVLMRAWDGLLHAGTARLAAVFAGGRTLSADPEQSLRAWPSAGAAWLGVAGLLLALALWHPGDQDLGAQPGIGTQPADAGRASPAPAGGDSARPETPVPAEVAASAGPPVPSEPAPSLSTATEGPPTLAPDASPAQGAAAAQGVAEDSVAVAPEGAACDPSASLVFAHPALGEPLRLSTCIRGEQGPVALDAPPLTDRLVALVQRHLNDLGYAAGPVDGRLGPRTRGAIRRFQEDRGSVPTGEIGFDLIRRLIEHLGATGAGAVPAESAGGEAP